jgi:hypothetical protein
MRARKVIMTLSPLSVVLLFTWALASCVTVITPQATPADPVDVFVVDHGRTSSLIVPAPDGTLVRYAYGDWNWYALGKHTLWRGIAALFWPTPGALGRGILEAPATVESVRHQIPSPQQIHCIPVERARLLAFETKMQAYYQSLDDIEVSNPAEGMSFVHHPHPYTVFWNSNHAVAAWLRELGSSTRGFSFEANWRVAAPHD